MMTLRDDCIGYGQLFTRWLFGLALAALGAYMIVEQVAVRPGIGILTFGIFILRPADLTAFAAWIKTNAADYFRPPTEPR